MCPDPAEAQPVQGAAQQLLTAFNPSDPRIAGEELNNFNFSLDTKGQSWNTGNFDPVSRPLTLTPCVSSGPNTVAYGDPPRCVPGFIYRGDSWAISNTHDGLDSIIGLFGTASLNFAAVGVTTPLVIRWHGRSQGQL